MIQFRNIEKSFGDKQVLHQIQLEIPEGVIYGIIGESGAGKSTLLRMINGLETIDRGSLLIEDEDVSQLSGEKRRQSVMKTATVFQHFNLLNNKTVYQNVLEPLRMYKGLPKQEREARAKEALAFVGLETYENVYPAQLSGGQKQRVGIARALALRPKILLCDEATSALDPTTARAISQLLKKINETYQTTIVFITHQLEIARELCHHVAVMDQGKIVEEGNVFDIFTRPQKPVTQQLIQHMLPQEYFDLDNDEIQAHIFKLQFDGESALQSVLFDTAFTYQIKVNVIGGQIQHIQGRRFGILIVGFETSDLQVLADMKKTLESHHIEVTKLSASQQSVKEGTYE